MKTIHSFPDGFLLNPHKTVLHIYKSCVIFKWISTKTLNSCQDKEEILIGIQLHYFIKLVMFQRFLWLYWKVR